MLQFNSEVAVTVYLILQLLWLIGAIGAAHDGMLTAGQMRRRHSRTGIPYLHHYGLWNDVLVVHPLCAILAGLFAPDWVVQRPWIIAVIAVVSPILSYFANHGWVKGGMRQAQGWDGKLLLAGWVHVPQMAIILLVILMSLCSFFILWLLDMMPWGLFLGCVSLMLAHVCMGWHWPLRVLNPEWNPFPDGESGGVLAYLYVLLTVAATGCFFLQLYPNVFQH